MSVGQNRRVSIELPKNSPLGLAIAVCAGIFGFSMVWHIWWAAALGVVAILAILFFRAYEEHIEYEITV